MANSDIFVLPSLSEGFPLVILEAMASGLPIIATKVGGLPSIIHENENGFIIETKNPEQIAEKTIMLLDNKKLRNHISKNNKLKSEFYDWTFIVDQLEDIYLKINNTS